MSKYLAAALVSLLLAARLVDAAPSSFDPSFGSSGMLELPAGRTVTRLDPLPDGSTLAILDNTLQFPGEDRQGFIVRVTADGHVDLSFAGGVLAFGCADAFACRTRVSTDPQGRVWIVAPQTYSSSRDIEMRRLLTNGAPDTAFGLAGVLRVRTIDYCTAAGCPFSLDYVQSITTFADGRALLVAQCSIGPAKSYGSCLIGVSGAGSVESIHPVPGFFQTFAPTPAIPAGLDGSVFVVGSIVDEAILGSRVAILKVLANGDVDASFGNAGIVTPALPATLRSALQAAATENGGLVLLGLDASGVFGYSATFARLTADGNLDPTFGNGGIVSTREFTGTALATLDDGSVLAAGEVQGQAAVLRLRRDGSRESRFGGQGIISYAFKGGSAASSIAVRPDGRILVGGFDNVGIRMVPVRLFEVPIPVHSPLLFQIQGGLAPVDRFWLEATAVEYFNPAFGHYFVTANGGEEYNLDLAPDVAWIRTGKQFNVWYQPAPELAEVCRFWSDQSFAPKSSHFYTPYAGECAKVRADSVWRHEGTAFFLRLPEGTPGARVCPSGSRPLYRAYNNGLGGAPNHRYTTDIATLDAMVAQGWVTEGEAQTRVFACAPAAD